MPNAGTKGLEDVYIALLRGINLGGANRLPTKELVQLFQDLGCVDVKTYIQSGNVVYRAQTQLAAAELPARISQAILEKYGFKVPVVMRTGAELEEVAAHNPFLEEGVDPKTLHVAFLQSEPDPAQIAQLDPGRSPPDAFSVRGREIYIHYPNGVARSKLTNQYFDSKLKTTSTVRNWNTVLKLLEMARSL